jgi:hypothetical protein
MEIRGRAAPRRSPDFMRMLRPIRPEPVDGRIECATAVSRMSRQCHPRQLQADYESDDLVSLGARFGDSEVVIPRSVRRTANATRAPHQPRNAAFGGPSFAQRRTRDDTVLALNRLNCTERGLAAARRSEERPPLAQAPVQTPNPLAFQQRRSRIQPPDVIAHQLRRHRVVAEHHPRVRL